MSTAIRSNRKEKLLPNRPLDYIYDPVFTVSNAKDYYKTVNESMKYSTDLVMQPNFSSMFSDIQHYPNSSLILKSAYPIPYFIDASFKGKSRSMARTKQTEHHIEVDGADRFRYFRKPCDLGKEIVPKKHTLQYKLLLTDFVDPSSGLFEKKNADADMLSSSATSPKPSSKNAARGVQTDYRESEAQTIPWTPPYVFHGSVTPEILTLANLSWGEGLPAGIHEVELIERARIKREWEKILLSSFKNPQDIERRQKCIIDMENSEWLFREQEIEKINSYRMNLAKKSMKGQKSNQFNRLDERVNRQIRKKELQKNEQLRSLQEKKEREMRKLMAKHKMWENKLKSGPDTKGSDDNLFAVKDIIDKKPLVFSTDHEVIKYDKMMFGTVEGLILMENAPSDPAPAFNFVKASKPKSSGGMCHKLCRWSTDEDLKQLQKDLQRTNVVIGHKTHALTKKEKVKPLLPPLLCIEIPVNNNVALYKATAFLQQLLRGRAVQYKVFQDRKRLQPLIEELKKTRSLNREENYALAEKRYEALALKRKQFVYNQLEGKRDEVVNEFNGEVTAALLDFLAKELQRLEAEKQVHALVMLAERERWQREAVESGRRQKEDFNRQQHDDMFKQVMNIRNESVDIFLEDMLAKSINWLADGEAREYVRNVAHKVDIAAQKAHSRKDTIEQEEMVTDLIYNYIMPDVKKAIIRHKLHESQKKYLEIADNIIQNELLNPVDPDSASQIQEQPADDGSTGPDESQYLNATDDGSDNTEALWKSSLANVFKTHCIRQTKSEEAYYALKARNQMFALQRAKLFKLAETVKEEFLDALIERAGEMALQVIHEKERDFVLLLDRLMPEAERRYKMAKLAVLADILNDDFLSNLIALAEEGKCERKQESDEERIGGETRLDDGFEYVVEQEELRNESDGEILEQERELEDSYDDVIEEKVEVHTSNGEGGSLTESYDTLFDSKN